MHVNILFWIELIYIYIYTYIRTYVTYVHIWSLNFDALAQGNLYDLILMLWHRENYKRTHTKEPINHRRPSGYRTHYLQTKKYRQLPVVQHVCFMPRHCVKTQSQWHARGCPRKFGFFSAKGLRWHDSHAIVACAKLWSIWCVGDKCFGGTLSPQMKASGIHNDMINKSTMSIDVHFLINSLAMTGC